MANILKAKLGISLFSISILILIPLLESNFNAPVTISRWRNLTWNDFKGFVPPFSGYSAAISSQVYLEFDSATSKYIAYAAQNNMRSWTKEKTMSSSYALNHEQYHFNITEIHARLLNEYIAANPNESEGFYRSHLAAINYDLGVMQTKYDDETDHSMIQGKQRHWEFRIDSLLSIHSIDSGWVTDYYSGAKIFFPSTPKFETSLTENLAAYRHFTLSKYDMTLSMISFQYYTEVNISEEMLRKYYARMKQEIKIFAVDGSVYKFKASVTTKDSLEKNNHHLWVADGRYLYNLSASYQGDTKDTLEYFEIANSFFSSFSIENTDPHWISRFEDSKNNVRYSPIIKTRKGNDTKKTTCIVFNESKPHGFFRGPMFHEDGDLMIAYDVIDRADSLLRENNLILNTNIYSYQPDSVNHIYIVPANHLPKGSYDIKFGYLLNEDSSKECYRLYYQALKIENSSAPKVPLPLSATNNTGTTD
jgi:hypothetical protein